MTRWLVAVVGGLVLASGAAGSTQKASALYAFLEGSGPDPLVRVDPESLRPVGKRLDVGSFGHVWSFSPDRSRLALGSSYAPTLPRPTSIRIVDLHRWRVERTISLPERLGRTTAVTWSRGRILVLVERAFDHEALAVDVQRGTIVASRPFKGSVLRFVAAFGRLVALVGARDAIGPARLVLADTDVALKTVPLDRITAGSHWSYGPADHPVGRLRTPGLVVHPDLTTAYVLSGGEAPAAVDLRTLRVRYGDARALSRTAKEVTGPWRFGLWAGANRLVFGGVDHGGGGTAAERIGVALLDATTWQSRTLDAGATTAAVGSGLVLTWDAWPGIERALGLRAFNTAGDPVWAGLPAASVGAVQIAGNRALVRVSDTGAKVVDLRSGDLVGSISGDVPHLLLGPASSW